MVLTSRYGCDGIYFNTFYLANKINQMLIDENLLDNFILARTGNNRYDLYIKNAIIGRNLHIDRLNILEYY